MVVDFGDFTDINSHIATPEDTGVGVLTNLMNSRGASVEAHLKMSNDGFASHIMYKYPCACFDFRI